MATFLLWNVRKQKNRSPPDNLIVSLIKQHTVDVALIVEYSLGASQLPALLASHGYTKRPSIARFGVFTYNSHHLKPLGYKCGNRAQAFKYTPPSGKTGKFILVHGYDRRNYSDGSRRLLFRRVAEIVESWEKHDEDQLSLVVGDFNAQPFDPSIVDADGLHAIGVRSIADEPSRLIFPNKKTRRFFYNPMWSMYGRQFSHPLKNLQDAGNASHYWTNGGVHELAWHMLDQVMVRPNQSDKLPEDRIRILTKVGNISLLDEFGIPDKNTASDHLPIVFDWNI